MALIGDQFWEDLGNSGLALTVRESTWVYPMLETAHVLGLALLFGAIVAFDLRVLGLSTELSISRLWQHVKPWIWLGFVVAFTSGVLLFFGDPAGLAANPAVQVKLALLLLAGINAAVFEGWLRPAIATGDSNAPAPRAARISAALSLSLWISILIAGRMIAYIK
jgi:hypothetical protein